VLREQTPPGMAEAQWMGKAFASAVRGAWDSAFVALQHWTRLSDDPQTVLRAYGLATLGVSTGAVAPDAALGWRPDPAQGAVAAEPDARAELAWLDGVNAFFGADTAAIAGALQALRGSGGRHAELLSASLRAFQRHAAGDPAGAARSLAELEWNLTGRGDHMAAARFHPHLSAIHRPAGARWLIESGDTVQALRLLTWHEAIVAGDRVYGRINNANRVVEPLALQQRARLEEALGRESVAREHYRAFLERYDRAPSAHQGLVADARAALHRLGDAKREVPAGPSRRSPEPRRAPRGEGLPPPAG
ncbi:MAG TPA: hypothetical protein VK933_03810, partial [Longimicrobiales bacterium]|nr:hypothetical protein [Longimicrobiales bacterium]